MKTSFLSGAKKEDCPLQRASAEVRPAPHLRRAECMNGRGELLTHHTLTYIRHHGAHKAV